MKLLAVVFTSIGLLATLPGFVMDVAPILALGGKIAAEIALLGLIIIGVAWATENLGPAIGMGAEDAQP
jgi:hypothetical protein